MRRRCQSSSAIVTSSAAAEAELLESGFSRQHVHRIPWGVAGGPERSADRRYRSRAALAEANHDLAVAEYAPVIAYVGRLAEPAALTQLLQAWRSVAQRWPSARLWLVGDGPARETLYEQIVSWELHHQVLMPGSFEDLTDVWAAADVLVAPQPHAGIHTALAAMAAGLPVVAADSPPAREIVQDGRTGWLVAPDDRQGWINALCHFCDRPVAAADMGRAARQSSQVRYPRRAMAQRHIELVEQLCKSCKS
jgi:glycosyltransferase involved in cell wall biosynthesis